VCRGFKSLLRYQHIDDRCRGIMGTHPVYRKRVWYTWPMTKDQMKEIFDRVLTWPPERQADIAHVVELMEEQDKSTLRLTDEQLAEVRRRRAKKNPNYVSLAAARKRFRDLGA
jgi:hypothetical protein